MSRFSVGFLGGHVRKSTFVPAATGSVSGNMSLTAFAFDGLTNVATTSCAVKGGGPGSGEGYIGKNFSSPKIIDKVVIYGANNSGFHLNSGSQGVTLSLYGKNGSAPLSGSDGTLLGTISIPSVINESAGRTITSSDHSTFWDYVWVNNTPLNSSYIPIVAELEIYEFA